jgi:uncharacterized protein
MQAVGPVQAEERITSLDAVRGFALLGILLMNIVGFGLHAAYDDPTNAGGAAGANLWAWIVMHVLAEGKMRCLFSMVFGAGVVLLTSRAERRGAGATTADIFYRRNLWLMIFGIAHAFLLWHGEILYPYALCALVLFPFRNMAPKALLSIGAAMLVMIAGANVYGGFELKQTIARGRAAQQVEKSGGRLTEEQTTAKEKWEKLRKDLKPTPEEVEKENRRWRGSIADVLKVRAEIVWRWHSLAYYHYMMLDLFSMMFIGMGFYKLGIFSAGRSVKFYAVMAIAGYLIGLSVNSYTAWLRVTNNFDLLVNAQSTVTYDIGRLSIALAHVGALMLVMKAGGLTFLTNPLGAIGQMALSNYLMHSVICSTIFCGYGFAMFGRLERHQLYYIVASIWLVQMIISPIWLRHFHFGPAEWAWRSLTYWKKQPMRKAAWVAAEGQGGLSPVSPDASQS